MISATTLETLHAIARRHSRVRSEAHDLVQDILLTVLESGRTSVEPGFLAWANGALRNHAAFVARTAVRRRHREQRQPTQPDVHPPRLERRLPVSFVANLPRALKVVALLVNSGMGRHEIAYLLGLNDTALRQRISGLKKALGRSGVVTDDEERSPPTGDGLQRRVLKQSLPDLDVRRFAIRDPDGHPIFFWERPHTLPARGNRANEPPGDVHDP